MHQRKAGHFQSEKEVWLGKNPGMADKQEKNHPEGWKCEPQEFPAPLASILSVASSFQRAGGCFFAPGLACSVPLVTPAASSCPKSFSGASAWRLGLSAVLAQSRRNLRCVVGPAPRSLHRLFLQAPSPIDSSEPIFFSAPQPIVCTRQPSQ